MKQSFKDAAKKYLKGSTLTLAFCAAGFAYGGHKAYQYYTPSPHKTAYAECIAEKKPCTPEQMGLAENHTKLGMQATVWLMIPQMWLLMGLGYRKDEKHKERQRELLDQKHEYFEKYINEKIRASGLEDELAKAQAQLAPYLADATREADEKAKTAATQQLDKMATDATTLQGQIKVGKKITIKPPPATPQQP